MKNIINEKPSDELYGRTSYIIKYVDRKDIKGKYILNIGCGFGWFEYRMLSEEINHISAIDVNEVDIEMNKSYLTDDKVDFKVGSAIDLPFESEFFDTIVCWDVIEHIPPNTEVKMFKEIERVLKQEGVFYISTPYKSFIGTALDPAWWLIKHRHYGKKQLNAIINEAGKLRILEMDVRGGIWDILSTINLYVAKWIFKRPMFFKKFFNEKSTREYDKDGINTLFVKGKKDSTKR